MLSINYRDPRPIYEQVRDGIRKLILSGAIQPGEKLPSVRSLAGTLAINPKTLQRAYRELEAEGFINTVAGKGAFAASDDRAAAQRTQDLLAQMKELVQELRLLNTPYSALLETLNSVYGEEDPT